MENTVQVPLYNRKGDPVASTLVDASDAPFVTQWRWLLVPRGSGYAYRYEPRVEGKQRRIYLHRVLLDLPAGDKRRPDHINRNGLDNRRANLRISTHAQNMQNRRPHRHSKSGVRGVIWEGRNQMWRVQVTVSGIRYRSGLLRDKTEAARLASEWRKERMPFAMEAA